MLALLALLLLAFALAGRVRLLPASSLLLGAGYAIVLLARGLPLLAAPLYGSGMLLVCELGYASLEPRRQREERGARSIGWLLALAGGAPAVASLPLAASLVQGPAGTGAELSAAAIAVLIAAVPAVLVHRR
jgi:hypothetical protein